MAKPANALIYYGWLNSFNSATNQWNNEKVAQDLARYDVLVFGDGIQNPSHGDYSNTQVIIPRIKALNPDVMIFGYVTVNQTMENFTSKVDPWDDLEVCGIFMDEAGYDYGKKRDEFNERAAYVKSKEYSNICFANAWNLDHILGTENDSSYPNTTYNPQSNESLLNEDDFVLLESFAVNTDAYTSNNGYASKSDWKARGDKAISMMDKYDVSMIACGIINDGNSNAQAMFDFSFRSVQVFNIDGHSISDSSYGASSAKSALYTPSGVKDIGDVMIAVEQDVGDSDVYVCYGDGVKISIDHSTGAQTSSESTW